VQLTENSSGLFCLFYVLSTLVKGTQSSSALRAASKSGHEVFAAKTRFSSRKRLGRALCRRKKKKSFVRSGVLCGVHISWDESPENSSDVSGFGSRVTG
jgi:hypothetical protein